LWGFLRVQVSEFFGGSLCCSCQQDTSDYGNKMGAANLGGTSKSRTDCGLASTKA